jgi:hypothetical protein
MDHDAVVLEVVGMIRVAIGAGLVGFARRHFHQGAGQETSGTAVGTA